MPDMRKLNIVSYQHSSTNLNAINDNKINSRYWERFLVQHSHCTENFHVFPRVSFFTFKRWIIWIWMNFSRVKIKKFLSNFLETDANISTKIGYTHKIEIKFIHYNIFNKCNNDKKNKYFEGVWI